MDPAREAAVAVLSALDGARRTARDALADASSPDADPRDRALTREIVLGAVRRRATLDHLLAGVSATPIRRMDPVVRASLRSALAQLFLLDRVPAHAAVDGAVEIVKAGTNPRLAGFVNGVLRTVVRGIEGPAAGPDDPRRDVPKGDGTATRLRNAAFPDPATDPDGNLALRFSHPAWLVARWRARLAPDVLRAALEGGISRAPAADPAVGPDAEPTIFARVAGLLDPHPGERILVVRAGRGGALLAVADLLGRGELVVAELEVARGEASPSVDQRVERAGLRVESVAGPAFGPWPFPPGTFDAVLLEAPSSSTGIFRRRPELADRLEEREITRFAARTRALLEGVLPLLKAGGRVVLATRSVEPEEGAALVEALVGQRAGLRVEPGFELLPSPATDGGVAVVVRLV